MTPPLATPSLRRRLIVAVLALVAVMLVVLAVVTDRVLADRLDGQLRQRLVDRAATASALVDQVDGRDLARRLEGEGVSVVLTEAGGQTYAEGPLAGSALATASDPQSDESAQPAPTPPGADPPDRPSPPGPAGADAAQVEQSGDTLSITRELSGGDEVVLLADAGDIATTMAQVRLALLLAGVLVLLVAAAAVPPVVRRALRPLDRITAAARSIAEGDRGLRLRPTDPETEMGRTAAAFDVMLDDITGAEERATASETRLREFLFDAAHELRTPLTGLQAAAERVLRDAPERAERERMLVMLVRESRRAGRLVEDMLLVARLDEGLALQRGRVDVAAVADQVATDRRLLRPEAEIEVDHGPAGGPAWVDGDPDRLGQLVANLVDNALQASGPAARVRVEVSVEGSQPGQTVVLSVSDDGPGVPREQRERIFERLVRLDDSRASRSGGVGLGLPIVRGLARAHAGEVRCVEPIDGVGARFEVRLPAATER